MPQVVRSAQISAVEWPELLRLRKPQSFGPCRRHKFFHGKPGRAAAPPPCALIPAEGARRPRIRCWALAQTTRGIPGKGEPGSHSSVTSRRCGTRRGKPCWRERRRSPPATPSHAVPGLTHLRADVPSCCWMSFRPPFQQKSTPLFVLIKEEMYVAVTSV